MSTVSGRVLLLFAAAVFTACTARERARAAERTDAAAERTDAAPRSNDVPVIPVGPDAYRDWAELPRLRIGARTYMRSTYDRTGGNEGADARDRKSVV